MSRKKTPKTKNTQSVRRERDLIPWRYCLLTLLCGLVLVGGFFFAARQHFSSIDYGIKNSLLRRQKDELETAQRQLLLAKEFALSPAEIKKAAKKIGLTEMTAANIEAFYPTTSSVQEKPKAEKSPETKQTNSNSTVSEKAKNQKPEKEVRTEKKTVESADSRTKRGVQQVKVVK